MLQFNFVPAVRNLKSLVLATLVVMQTGCGVLAPKVPDEALQPFEVRFQKQLGDAPAVASLEQIKAGVSAFSTELIADMNRTNKEAWTYSDITFFGVLGTVAGTAASKIGLRNTGAGAAALGAAFPAHYQTEPTFQAYLKGMKRTTCVQARIGGLPKNLDDIMRDLATTPNADDLKEVLTAYRSIPADIYSGMNLIRTDLALTILTSRPTEASVSDFNSTLSKFKNAAVTTKEAGAADNAARQQLLARRANAAAMVVQSQTDEHAAKVRDVLEADNVARLQREVDAKVGAYKAKKLQVANLKAAAAAAAAASGSVAGPVAEDAEEQRLHAEATKATDAHMLGHARHIAGQSKLNQLAVFTRKAQQELADANATTPEEQARVTVSAIEQVKALSGAIATCAGL